MERTRDSEAQAKRCQSQIAKDWLDHGVAGRSGKTGHQTKLGQIEIQQSLVRSADESETTVSEGARFEGGPCRLSSSKTASSEAPTWMTLLHPAPPDYIRRGGSPRLLDPQDDPMLRSLFVRKARSAHDLTTQAQRKLRTVVSEFFPDPHSSERQHPPPPPHRVDLFSRLPEELLIAILRYLDGSSIAACNQVR